MSDKATVEIRVWTEGRRKLPADLGEALAPHIEHVASLCAQGYTSGDVYQEISGPRTGFRGWWEIKTP